MRRSQLGLLLLHLSACVYDWKADFVASDAGAEPADATAPSLLDDGGSPDARQPFVPKGDAGEQRTEGNATQPPGGLTCADCDPLASCASGSTPVCVCPSGTLDPRGDGTLCEDPCAGAGCDANASCSIVDGQARCSCPANYVGDGKTCKYDESCSQLACDKNAECAVVGSTRSCKCRPGYEGPGTTCKNVDECATPVCGAHGTCIDSPGSHSCLCTPGYSGASCEIDACTTTSCAPGSSCQHNLLGVSCVPACSPNCPAGNACTADDQCVQGATCHPTGRVCVLSSCAGGKITFPGDLSRLKYCASVAGTLTFASGGVAFSEWSLPYLKSISGGLVSELNGELKSPTVQFEVLESIGGDLQLGLVVGVDTLSLPQLRSIGGNFIVGMCSFSSINVGRLTTIGKDLVLLGLDRANTISIGALQTVTGTVSVNNLPGVSWSTLKNLANVGTTQSINTIGCSICPSTAEVAYMCTNGTKC